MYSILYFTHLESCIAHTSSEPLSSRCVRENVIKISGGSLYFEMPPSELTLNMGIIIAQPFCLENTLCCISSSRMLPQKALNFVIAMYVVL